jgi:hypothetical protein
MDQVNPHDHPSGSPGPKSIGAALRLVLIATTGTLIVLGMQLIPTFFLEPTRPSVLQPTSTPQGPDFVSYMFRQQHFISSPYVIVPWFLAMVYLAISRRNQPKSWLYALLAGGALPSIIFHYILHWI